MRNRLGQAFHRACKNQIYNNFKVFGQILVSGKLSEDYITEIKSYLDSGEFFVAEQVNIPTLYSQLWKYSNGPTIADHAFHEFSSLRLTTENEIVWKPGSDHSFH